MDRPDAYALILARMAETKDEVLAASLKCDRSQISRIRSGERGIRVTELDRLLAPLGLMLVDASNAVVTMPAERAQAIEYLAREALIRRGEV